MWCTESYVCSCAVKMPCAVQGTRDKLQVVCCSSNVDDSLHCSPLERYMEDRRELLCVVDVGKEGSNLNHFNVHFVAIAAFPPHIQATSLGRGWLHSLVLPFKDWPGIRYVPRLGTSSSLVYIVLSDPLTSSSRPRPSAWYAGRSRSGMFAKNSSYLPCT